MSDIAKNIATSKVLPGDGSINLQLPTKKSDVQQQQQDKNNFEESLRWGLPSSSPEVRLRHN